MGLSAKGTKFWDCNVFSHIALHSRNINSTSRTTSSIYQRISENPGNDVKRVRIETMCSPCERWINERFLLLRRSLEISVSGTPANTMTWKAHSICVRPGDKLRVLSTAGLTGTKMNDERLPGSAFVHNSITMAEAGGAD